jgi:hypothetical protein
VLVITRLSKERCVSLAAGKIPSRSTHKHVWNRCGLPSTWKTYSSKMGLSKIWNLKHKYGTTKT